MAAGNHDCFIGLLHHYDYSELCTLSELKKHIADQEEYNDFWKSDPVYSQIKSLGVRVFTLREYADKRRKTDLKRFEYCPECGKRINWAALKGE